MTIKLYYLLVFFNGRWKNMDSFAKHTEEEAASLIRQWRRSGYKAEMQLACVTEAHQTNKRRLSYYTETN